MVPIAGYLNSLKKAQSLAAPHIVAVTASEVVAPSLDGVGRLDGPERCLHARLVKLEVTSLVFAHVSEVEGDADEVALSGVVALIVIVVNDHLSTVVLSGGHVLEVIQVKRVG